MLPPAAGRSGANCANVAVRCLRMKLALDDWETGKPVLLRMLTHDLAMGAEAAYHLCDPECRAENVEGGRPPTLIRGCGTAASGKTGRGAGI